MKKLIGSFSILILLVSLLSLSSGCSKSTTTTSPTLSACIDAPSGTITAGTAFTFTSGCTTGSNIVSYAWSFGDGGTATTASPSHTYASAGSYTVTLIITTASNASTATKSVTVVAGSGTTLPQDFAGTYSVFDACQSTVSYNETVTTSGSTATISNMGNHGTNVTGTINGSSITIASQNFYTSGGSTYTVSGNGNLSADHKTLNITFSAVSGFGTTTCNVIGTKP